MNKTTPPRTGYKNHWSVCIFEECQARFEKKPVMAENVYNQFGLDTTGSQNSDASYLCYIFFVQNMNFWLIKFIKEVRRRFGLF